MTFAALQPQTADR